MQVRSTNIAENRSSSIHRFHARSPFFHTQKLRGFGFCGVSWATMIKLAPHTHNQMLKIELWIEMLLSMLMAWVCYIVCVSSFKLISIHHRRVCVCVYKFSRDLSYHRNLWLNVRSKPNIFTVCYLPFIFWRCVCKKHRYACTKR